ncbi:MAG: tripartite tricarboxylate transporter substrate binding protein [Candidatus Protistobacter heckmanni]|nr:tripartite tricarboxylate transporter substrate binding protein [Candidatus Protistobacter heckmanni]
MCCANALHAQADYPVKPVRLVVAFPPGDPTDLVSRVLAQKMSEQMGQQVVVDNRPGANGNFAAEVVAKSAPDGYTVFYNTSAIALSPALYAKLGYDVLADFSPVALTAVVPLVLAVHPSMPMANVREFVAYAKAHPGKLTYGSAGNGNVTHLASFLFLQANGIDAVHAPYKGSAPALTDAAGGQVQFITDTINSALPFIKDKRLRALAVTSARRTTVLPEVPTLAETLMPGFEVGAWQGMLVPAGTPPAVVRRLSQEVNKALASPEVKARLAVQGAEPLGSTPEQYGAYIRGELERWAKVVKQIGAKLD